MQAFYFWHGSFQDASGSALMIWGSGEVAFFQKIGADKNGCSDCMIALVISELGPLKETKQS